MEVEAWRSVREWDEPKLCSGEDRSFIQVSIFFLDA
jgi:hypothetical protein